MTYFFLESNKISCLIFFSIFSLTTIVSLSYLLSESTPDIEESSSYECGFDPYEDAKKLFKNFNLRNFKSVESEFALGLLNLQLSYLYETLVSPNTFLYLLIILYFILYFFVIKEVYKIFVEANREALTLLCKRFQNFLNDNQVAIFFLVNLLVFLGLSCLFDPIVCLIVHVLWLDVYFLFYLFFILELPIVQVVLIASLIFRALVFGFYNSSMIYLALGLFYVLCWADEFGLFDSVRAYIQTLKEDQAKLLNHKKTEFTYFYVLEQQYLVLLIAGLLLPGIVSEVGLNFTLNIAQEDFLLHVNFYMYSFIMVISVINLLVIWFFNPGPLLKTAAACLGCIGGVAGVGAFYVGYQASVWDRATGGIREPGPSNAVAEAQLAAYKARITTAQGIKQAKIYREIFPGAFPLHPGTNIVNNAEVGRALVEDTTPLQKQRIDLMVGRNSAGLPYPKENPIKSLASKTGKP